MNLPPYPFFPDMMLVPGSILLKEIQAEDIPELVEISFYDGKQAQNLAEAIEMQAKIDADYQNCTSIHWAIVNTETKEIVGTCGYYRGFENETGELGCILKAAFRGQGYMTTALSLAVTVGLDIIGLTTIKAITTKDNVKAIRLLERLTFIQSETTDENRLEFCYYKKEIPCLYE